jgi:hypothetical protein
MTSSVSRAAKRPLQLSEALGRVGTSVTFVELVTANLGFIRIPVASRAAKRPLKRSEALGSVEQELPPSSTDFVHIAMEVAGSAVS